MIDQHNIYKDMYLHEREREIEREEINARMGEQTQGHVFTRILVIVLSRAIKQSRTKITSLSHKVNSL